VIELCNTYTGRKEPLQPAGDRVTMYVCGLTPKNHPHIGHAWLFVHVDVMRRYLEFSGYKVDHVQNFTDVDDKIIEAGQRDGISPEQAAEVVEEVSFPPSLPHHPGSSSSHSSLSSRRPHSGRWPVDMTLPRARGVLYHVVGT